MPADDPNEIFSLQVWSYDIDSQDFFFKICFTTIIFAHLRMIRRVATMPCTKPLHEMWLTGNLAQIASIMQFPNFHTKMWDGYSLMINMNIFLHYLET